MNKIRQFIISMISLCKWFKIIWHDRNNDFEYLLLIEQYKLRLMLVNFENVQEYANNKPIDIKYILLCIKLIDIIIEPYGTNYINTKNSILYNKLISDGISVDTIKEYMLDDIRQDKALRLYNKIKNDKLLTWWI